MRAVQLLQPSDVVVQEVTNPVPRFGEVLVSVEACGVCGTDLHIFDGHFAPTPYPIIPGHEFSGTLVELGPGVDSDLEVGARVAVDPTLACGHCAPCRRGRPNLCANWGATGDTVDGAFAELVAVPARNAYLLPDHVSFEQGALVEPLSCAVHGVRRVDPEPGDSALVVGVGTMGLLLVQLLALSGLEITAVDKVAAKLDLAGRTGASRVTTDLDQLRDERFDVVVDVTGVATVIEQALGLVRPGGKFLVFGVASEDARVALSPFRVYNDEITIVGSMAVLHSFGRALELIASGRVRCDELVTDRFTLEGYEKAISAVRSGDGIKVHVLPATKEGS